MTSSISGPRSGSSGAPADNGWRELLAGFSEATAALMTLRALRRRADSKFVLSPASAAALVDALARGGDYAVLAAGRSLIASYRTLYFDTAELELFHAQRRGRRVRHKVRVRHYPDRRVSLLEVKTRRSELQTFKTWRERGYGDDSLDADDQAFIDSRTGLSESVLPQVWTDFRRVTLLGIRTNERVTVDLGLRVGMGERVRSLEGVAIVEVKQWPYDRATPVMTALRAAGQRPAWASKYCMGIAWTRPEVRRHRLLPGLRTLERAAA